MGSLFCFLLCDVWPLLLDKRVGVIAVVGNGVGLWILVWGCYV